MAPVNKDGYSAHIDQVPPLPLHKALKSGDIAICITMIHVPHCQSCQKALAASEIFRKIMVGNHLVKNNEQQCGRVV